MTRRVDPEFQFPDMTERRFDWRKWLAVAIIVLVLAMGAYILYKNVRA